MLDQNNFTLPWRRWLQNLAASNGSVTPAQLAAVAAIAEEALTDAEMAQSTANNAVDIANEALNEAQGLNVLSLLGLAELDGFDG